MTQRERGEEEGAPLPGREAQGHSSAGAGLPACWPLKRGRDHTHLEASGSLKEDSVGRKPDRSHVSKEEAAAFCKGLNWGRRGGCIDWVPWPAFPQWANRTERPKFWTSGQEKDWRVGLVERSPAAPPSPL